MVYLLVKKEVWFVVKYIILFLFDFTYIAEIKPVNQKSSSEKITDN